MSTLPLPPCLGGKYRPLRHLGAGGMGSVFVVEHQHTGELLALKLLHARARLDERAVERFRREARILVRLKSEHVVRVVDADVADELDGAPFLVMELLEGHDLGVVARSKPQPPAIVSEWMRQAALALDRAHAAGVVHRDLKPENLFLTRRDDGSPLLKVLDFGIAKLVEAEPIEGDDHAGVRTSTGAIFGTPLYMSPEQATGGASAVGPPSDVWSLAMVAFRLLAGKPYWKAATPAHVLAQIVYESVVPPSARGLVLGDAFDRWFLDSCRRAPGQRWPSPGLQAEALADALSKAPLPQLASPSSDAPRAPSTLGEDRSASTLPTTLGNDASVSDLPAALGDDASSSDLPAALGDDASVSALPATIGDDASVPWLASQMRAPTITASESEATGPKVSARLEREAEPLDPSHVGGKAAHVTTNSGENRATEPGRLRPARRWLWGGLGVAAALMAALAYPLRAGLNPSLPEPIVAPSAGARPFVLVLPFRGADERWPAALGELLAEQLRVGDALRTPAPDARVAIAGGIGSAAPPSAADFARLRRLAGVDYAVGGEAREEGATIRAKIEVYDALRGVPLGVTISLSGPASDPAGFARDAGARVRRLLGRPQLSIEDDVVLRSALPESAAATAAYVAGLSARRRFHFREAAAHFEETLRLSPRYGPAWYGLAHVRMMVGEHARAREAAARAEEFAPSLPRVDELYVYALAAETRKDWGAAAEKYRVIAQFYPDRIDQVASLARALVYNGKSEEALVVLAEARRRSLSEWDRMRIALMEAYAYERRSEDAKSLVPLKEVEALAEGAGQSVLLAEALIGQADAHLRAGHLDEAEPLYVRARELFAQVDDTLNTLESDSGLARIAELRGDFDRALAVYERIVERRRADGDTYGLARETVQVGIVYATTGQITKARDYFDRGGALFASVNDREGTAHRALNISTMDLELGVTEGVREVIARGRSIHEAIGYRAGVAEADGLLARIAWLEGAMAEAETAYETAYREAKEASESELTATLALGRARLALERGRADEPARFEEARAAVTASGSTRLGVIALALASSRALSLGDAAEARRRALEAEELGRKAHSIDALTLALAASLNAFAAPLAAQAATQPTTQAVHPAAQAAAAASTPTLDDNQIGARRNELTRLLGSLESLAPRLDAITALAHSDASVREARLREAVQLAESKRLPTLAAAAHLELGLALATPEGAREAAAAETRLRGLGAKGLARAVRASRPR